MFNKYENIGNTDYIFSYYKKIQMTIFKYKHILNPLRLHRIEECMNCSTALISSGNYILAVTDSAACWREHKGSPPPRPTSFTNIAHYLRHIFVYNIHPLHNYYCQLSLNTTDILLMKYCF